MVCVMSCSNNNPTEVKDEPIVEEVVVEEEPVDTVEVEVEKKSEIGTYTFSDDFHKYELTLNNDGTAVLNSTQMNLTDYGSWEVSYSFKNTIEVNCSGDQFHVTLPDGSTGYTSFIYLKDGYVYFSITALKAKHPKKRLAFTKR